MLNYSHQVTFMVEWMHQAKLGVHSNTPSSNGISIYVISPRHGYPEGMSKLHKEVAEMSMVLPPPILPSLPDCTSGLMQIPTIS